MEQNHKTLGFDERAVVLQLCACKAAELARSGQFAEAESLLSKLVSDGITEPPVYDLLARIQAQRGNYSEAESLWKRALALDPQNQDYAAGLKRVSQVKRSRPLPVLRLALGLAAVLSVLLVIWLVDRGASPPLDSPPDKGRVQGAQPGISNQPSLELRIPDIDIHVEGDALVGKFKSGLFVQGASLTTAAEASLKNVARELQSHMDDISVAVIGHTDNVPIRTRSRYKDNSALGLRRAVSVVEYLSESGGLPVAMFVVGSAGEQDPPYPNDSVENRFRNRTVTLRITKKPG